MGRPATVPARPTGARAPSPFVRERVMGSFTRRVYLSEHLDAEAIEAAYDNGVLAVRIPVLEKARPRKVAVQQSGRGRKAIKS